MDSTCSAFTTQPLCCYFIGGWNSPVTGHSFLIVGQTIFHRWGELAVVENVGSSVIDVFVSLPVLTYSISLVAIY